MLADQLCALPGVKRMFSGPVFHEFVLELEAPVADVLHALRGQGILGGLAMTTDYPELGNALLTCATETKRGDDLARYATNMQRILDSRARSNGRASTAFI
jgi:glycine dehydrogenase subunit 1